MNTADRLAAREIGDGAGHPEDAGVAARGQTHRFGGLSEKFATGFVWRGNAVEQRAIRLCVRAYRVVAVSLGLDRPGGGNASGNLSRAFGRRRENQVGGADSLYVDVKVDSVE
ncbi:hypothetical protein C8J42_101617 [Sphingomonas sp. PP-CE-1A-559]|nr:hypothetical protein C8J42_101617 [Sphingomonas sp. PP-CE-1A-559]